MRRFLTIGITGKGKVDVIQSAEAGKSDHVDEFNKLTVAGKKSKSAKKSKYAEVQVIDLSRGVVKRKRFGGVDGGGKRTVARTVKKRKASPARTKKRAARKTAKKSAPKKAAVKKSAKPKTAKVSATPAASESAAPKLPGASEAK